MNKLLVTIDVCQGVIALVYLSEGEGGTRERFTWTAMLECLEESKAWCCCLSWGDRVRVETHGHGFSHPNIPAV